MAQSPHYRPSLSLRLAEEVGGDLGLLAGGLALIYIGVIAAVASGTGAFYILFPELGALSYDALTRPRGRWASAPLLLAITPALAGAIGTVVTRSLPYGFISVAITVSGAFAVLATLRSPIAPAISAGLLPLVIGVESWWYPPGILFGSTLLALTSILWQRYALAITATATLPPWEEVEFERGRRRMARWIGEVLAFVLIAVVFVKLTGWRFILFPPLVVIVYEMLREPAGCTWASAPVRLPLVCFLSAAGGLMFHDAIAYPPLAAILSMLCGIVTLRIFRLHVPPALAVALLPMVMNRPTLAYPVAVGIGAALAAVWASLTVPSGQVRSA